MNKIQIIYTSKACGDLDDAQIIEIYSTALRNNTQAEVTGMLLYTKGTFLQVIEGDAATIDRLIEKIKADKRHHDVEVVVRNSIKNREFKNWSMGYRRLGDADARALLNFAPFFENGFDAKKFCEQPSLSLEILRGLAAQLDDDQL